MQLTETALKDAAAVILLREDTGEVYLARRNPKIKFLGGYYAFPGGKTDAEDAKIEVKNCEDGELGEFIACAVRETFEETSVLLARGGDKITKGQRASLHDDLTSGRFSFREILEAWGLWIDARDFFYTGFWTTPTFSPVRFKTRFFAAFCPRRQEAKTFGEFVEGEFTSPQNALRRWKRSEILIAPPVLIALETLAACGEEEDKGRGGDAGTRGRGEEELLSFPADSGESLSPSSPLRLSASPRLFSCGEKLLEKSRGAGGEIRYIKLNPYVTCFPLRTETLPPATHTNCFIVGEKEFVVIDAASLFTDEQAALHAHIDRRIEGENNCRAIVITHLHPDHTGGAVALQNHLRERFNLSVPIAAHAKTAESLKGKIKVERFIKDEEVFKLKTSSGETVDLKALHTPGHARGHLCFYDERRGFLLSGDNVVGTGSVLIAPPEGNMRDYLASLERMQNLPNLRFLCGSHGAATPDAQEQIESYIKHRLEREQSILEALRAGAKTPREIVKRVYQDVSTDLWPLAEKSVAAHLEKLKE